ncbi:MAG: TetR family transcriptional regulator [Verrucomicrobiae bacterium]|nr:TetR family transcriptional regulator [Verrucomicrobiae bacterium]
MATTSVTDPNATRFRLMDVAEELFAEQGFEAVSLRHITTAAGANLAAVHYHFGSKEGLIVAVLQRWLRPLNERRLKLLAKVLVEAEGAGHLPDVNLIAEAFVRPPLELYRKSDHTKGVFFRLMGRCMLETREDISAVLLEEFREVVDSFSAAFRKSLPHLTPQDVTVRMMFMAGAMAHTILNIDKLAAFHGRKMAEPSTDKLIRQMVDFVGGGFPGVVKGCSK